LLVDVSHIIARRKVDVAIESTIKAVPK
jgi:hypothetical protein